MPVQGAHIPAGWALNSAGNPTTDPNVGLQGSMAPAMTSATLGAHAAPFFGTAGGPPKTGQFFIAIDPAAASGHLPRAPCRVFRGACYLLITKATLNATTSDHGRGFMPH